MFLKSLLGPLHYLQNPWILLFWILLGLAYLGFLLLIRRVTRREEATSGAGPGCLAQFLGVFIQTFWIALFNLLLLPLFFGVSDQVSLSAVEPMGFVAIRAGLFAMILVTLISFFPYIGKLLANSPGLEGFLVATLSFRFLSPIYLEALLGEKASIKNLFPSYWNILLYFLIALVLTRLVMALLLNIFRNSRWKPKIIQSIGPTVDLLVGMLPFLMYVQAVTLNYQRLAGNIAPL